MIENLTPIIGLYQSLGIPVGYIATIVAIVFIAPYLIKHYVDIQTTRFSTMDNQFNKFFELIEKDKFLSKSSIELEHKFEIAYKLYLSAAEIQHALKSNEPLLFIRNLKNCRWLLNFDSSKLYYLKSRNLSLKTKKRIVDIGYYFFALTMTIFFIGIFLSTKKSETIAYSIFTLEFAVGTCLTLKAGKDLSSAIKVTSGYFYK